MQVVCKYQVHAILYITEISLSTKSMSAVGQYSLHRLHSPIYICILNDATHHLELSMATKHTQSCISCGGL